MSGALVQRDAKGHWLKGSVPNPGGRPKGLAAAVRGTVDVTEIIAFAHKVLRGEPIRVGGANGYDAVPSMNDMKWAAQFLSDRGWGLPNVNVSISEVPETERFDATALSRSERDELERLLARAAGEAVDATPVLEAELVEVPTLTEFSPPPEGEP